MAAFLSGDAGLMTSLFLPCCWMSGLSLSGWWRTHHWNARPRHPKLQLELKTSSAAAVLLRTNSAQI